MNNIIYLASSSEVDNLTTLHDTFDEAVASGQLYIDKFVGGKHIATWKRIGYDQETHSFQEPPLYSDDGTKW